MQRRLLSPPCFVVVEVVLRKSAHVHDAELRIDGRPSVGSRLASIVEASPGKSTRFPLMRTVELPPSLRSFPPTHDSVVGIHSVPDAVGNVDAASADGARGFRSKDRTLGILFVECFRPFTGVVVESDDVERHRESLLVVSVYGSGNHPGWVQAMAQADHAGGYAHSLLRHRILQNPLLVPNRPQNDRRRVAIAEQG